ncbi:MAG: hypothetical protein ACI841_000673 [Planctomycetota bacterium]|jgi:hypothetical protein
MLQAARLAPRLLEDATEKVQGYLSDLWCPDGGAVDRAEASDLYYTAFTLDAYVALRMDAPTASVTQYLNGFGSGAELDFVHRACLVRCWAAIDGLRSAPNFERELLPLIEECRTPDGGYAAQPGAKHGTLYHAFLALGMYQDLGLVPPDARAVGESFDGLRSKDGAYANATDLLWGTTPSTAAASEVLRQLGIPVPEEIGPWLLQQIHEKGGFTAMPDAPIPDLLSTATALHALAGLELTIGKAMEPTLDFVDTLWSGRGFYGHWAEDVLDSEYTFYGLLALGHLSLGS